MSLILDALNRSRQDSEQIPGLASQHTAAPVMADSEGGIGPMQWLLVLGLALAVLAIGWLLMERRPPAAKPAAVPAAALPAAVSKPAPKTDTGPVVAASAQTLPAAVEGSSPPAQQAAAAPAAASAQAPAPPAVDPSVAALYQQQGPADTPAPTSEQPVPTLEESRPRTPPAASAEEEAIDIEKLVAQAQAELADARLEDTGVPFLAALSQQTKDSIPSLMYQRHDYSGKPGKSRVHINGKTLAAGASVRGVKIVEILPESVVLEFQGTRFRLRALNSWVNL